MQPLRACVIFLGIIFLGGALLSPWVYELAQFAFEHSLLPLSIARQPFPRYVNRSLLFLTLAGLWPFLRSSGLHTWRDLGLKDALSRWRQTLWGLLIGFGSLAVVVLLAILTGTRGPNNTQGPEPWLRHAFSAAGVALLVGTMEEIIFRGALLGALAKSLGKLAGLWLSSLVYAAAHFFKRAEGVDQIQWDSGVLVLLDMARGFAQVGALVPEFLNLTLAGALLGWLFQRTGDLYASIGLHTGWIFWLKLYGFATVEKQPAARWFLGSERVMDGWLAAMVLLASFFAIRRFSPPHEAKS